MNKSPVPVTKGLAEDEAEIPEADLGWHPIARRWYESLAKSGQSVYYASSDWMTAFAVAESMSREFKPQCVGRDAEGAPIWAEVPPKAAALTGWLKACALLLATEGDRRRMRLELARPTDGDEVPDVADFGEFRRRLGAG